MLKRAWKRLTRPRWIADLPQDCVHRSPLAFAPVEQATIWQRGSGVWREPPGVERVLTRAAPAFHDHPDGAPVLGLLRAATIPQHPVFVLAAERVFQIGARSYVTRDGAFFNDEVYSEAEFAQHTRRLASDDPFMNEYTGLRPIAGERFHLERRDRSIRHLAGDVVSLCSNEAGNYGSFLFRTVPKMANLGDFWKGRTVLVPPLWPANRQLLSLAGVPDERIVVQEPGVIYAIDRVIVPSLRNPHGLLDAASQSFYAGLRERYGKTGQRWIYVSRDGWHKRGSSGIAPRAMVNEAEVITALEGIGFDTVRPHELNMREHIEKFSSASLVVSAGGSMLFNTYFCNPGTKIIDIESEPHWIFMHMNLLGSAGHDFGIFEGRPADRDWSQVHKPFTVNVPALVDRVRRFAASPAPIV